MTIAFRGASQRTVFRVTLTLRALQTTVEVGKDLAPRLCDRTLQPGESYMLFAGKTLTAVRRSRLSEGRLFHRSVAKSRQWKLSPESRRP